jgi:predicted enzyme related to lactoylglutathione lyase
MTGEVGFFELGVEDVERGRAFYEGLFGWRFEPGPSGQGYTIATPTIPGGMHGGDRAAAPYIFFHVEDMDAALERVVELGGSVDELHADGDEDTIARFGRFKLCRDDQGSSFGLRQPPSAS